MDQVLLRNNLNKVVKVIGIKSKSISQQTGISQSELSRFKNGQLTLGNADAETLDKYLDVFSSILPVVNR